MLRGTASSFLQQLSKVTPHRVWRHEGIWPVTQDTDMTWTGQASCRGHVLLIWWTTRRWVTMEQARKASRNVLEEQWKNRSSDARWNAAVSRCLMQKQADTTAPAQSIASIASIASSPSDNCLCPRSRLISLAVPTLSFDSNEAQQSNSQTRRDPSYLIPAHQHCVSRQSGDSAADKPSSHSSLSER